MPNCSERNRNAQRSRYYAKHRKYAKNSGKRWSAEDEREITRHSVCDVRLSHKLGRSVQAIQIRRCRIQQEEQ